MIAVDSVSIVDDAGTTIAGAPFGNAALVLDLLGEWIGPIPEGEPGPYWTSYTWAGGQVSVITMGPIDVPLHEMSAAVWFKSPDAGGLELRTSQGIHVGSSRADVLGLDRVDDGYDSDGDGLSDQVGLEPVKVPGTESLTHPGEVGTAYISVNFTGDTVASLFAEGGDFHDI